MVVTVVVTLAAGDLVVVPVVVLDRVQAAAVLTAGVEDGRDRGDCSRGELGLLRGGHLQVASKHVPDAQERPEGHGGVGGLTALCAVDHSSVETHGDLRCVACRVGEWCHDVREDVAGRSDEAALRTSPAA